MARIQAGKRIQKQHIHLTVGILAAFVIFALCAMLFVKIAIEVREKETLAFDDAVLEAIHGASNHFLNGFMPIATDIGGVVGVGALTVIFLALFIYKNEQRRALVLAVCVAGASALNVILKSVFERARPDLWGRLVNEAGFSFPSGHAMASSALGIALVVVLWNSRWRWWAFTAATAYILFVGYSRLYLGVHYPTDIFAGWLVSGSWVMAVALIFRSRLGNKALSRLKG